MQIESNFGIGQELEIRNFMEVKKYGIKNPFVTIHRIDNSSVDIFVERLRKAEGFKDLENNDMYYACNGKFDKHYFGGTFLWERHLYSTEKDEKHGGYKIVHFNLALALTPVSEDVMAALKADIEYMKEHGVTGFFANYTICNGGGSYKDMALEDATIAPAMKDGVYIGFKVINLSNHNIVTSQDLRKACREGKEAKDGKYLAYDEHPRSNDYNSDRDHFYGGLYINKKVKTNESGYDASL
jgi:hypothetical protein